MFSLFRITLLHTCLLTLQSQYFPFSQTNPCRAAASLIISSPPLIFSILSLLSQPMTMSSVNIVHWESCLFSSVHHHSKQEDARSLSSTQSHPNLEFFHHTSPLSFLFMHHPSFLICHSTFHHPVPQLHPVIFSFFFFTLNLRKAQCCTLWPFLYFSMSVHKANIAFVVVPLGLRKPIVASSIYKIDIR